MKKSASMGCLSSVAASSAASNHPGSPSSDPHRDHGSGYASDDPAHGSCSSSSCRSERKKGIPWTEEEHKMFLVGLQKLGKGDWRGIARNFVVSRTPTQVASHAQKYFIRQTNTMRRKRRSSLFDMPMDDISGLEEQIMLQSPPNEPESSNKLQLMHINPGRESKPKETSLENPPSEPQENTSFSTVPLAIPIIPAFCPAFVPVPLPFWPGSSVAASPITEEQMGESHEVLKPTPVLLKDPINVSEVVSMSKLSICESNASCMEPSALSLKLLGASSPRPSAFHINPSTAGPDLNQSKTNAIHAV